MAEKNTRKKKANSAAPAKTAKQTKQSKSNSAAAVKLWCWVIALFVIGIFMGVFLYAPNASPASEFIDLLFSGLFGAPAKLLPVLLVALSVYLGWRRSFVRLGVKAALCTAALLAISALFQIFSAYEETVSVSDAFSMGANLHYGGGSFGALLTGWLVNLTGVVASAILYNLVLLILLIFIFKFSPIRFLIGFFKSAKEEAKTIRSEESYAAGRRAREAMDNGLRPLTQHSIDLEVFDEDAKPAPTKEKKRRTKREELMEEAEKHLPADAKKSAIEAFDDIPVFDPISDKLKEMPAEPVKPAKKTTPATEEDALSAAELMLQEAQSNQFGQQKEKVEALSEEEAQALREQLDENAQYLPIPYRFPPTTLLKGADNKKRGDSREELRETAMHLVDTLKSFGVDVKLLQVSRGPTVTRYELQPSVGVKVSKITNLSDDIALNLAAAAVRIEAPIPGKAAIGIEIPNKEVAMVSLRETLETDAFKNAKSKLAVALGMDITGNPIIADIAKFPHALIAGATGSGKSVCINSIITSILYKADPNEVKLMMIDPKVVELGVYNDIPHLLIPVVTDPKKASGALAWAVSEMTRRYNLFAKSGVRDLAGYNEVLELDGEPKLPQIVIIIDELADLMMVAPKEIEDSICRLAQMARAAGMYIIIATQRPSVNVITGVIKANIPTRIAFAVSSQIDSRTILDSMGAEKLLGKGDMLFMPFGASKPTRLQGAFVSDKEVESVVEFIKDTSKARYDEDITEKINSSAGTAASEEMEDGDDLLPKAIEIAIASGSISTSMIQRRLGVGYARAGRIIDQMEARGIISGPDGSKPRNVLVSHEELFSED